MTEEKRAELLMDHYKDTFDHLLYHWKVRNRLFIYILILLAALVLDATGKGSIADIFNRYLDKTVGAAAKPDTTKNTNSPKIHNETDNTDKQKPAPITNKTNTDQKMEMQGEIITGKQWIEFSAIKSLCWFLLMCLVIQYYQRSIHVDRQYAYIEQTENQLCVLMGGDYVTREGKSYSSTRGVYIRGQKAKWPKYLSAVGPLYTIVFPSLLTLSLIIKIGIDIFPIKEFPLDTKHIMFFFNIMICLGIIFYNIYYIYWVLHERKK
jgi:hypothetical protein